MASFSSAVSNVGVTNKVAIVISLINFMVFLITLNTGVVKFFVVRGY